jgi:hypothetical protein
MGSWPSTALPISALSRLAHWVPPTDLGTAFAGVALIADGYLAAFLCAFLWPLPYKIGSLASAGN